MSAACSVDGSADYAALVAIPDSELPRVGAEVYRESRRLTARTVVLAGRMYDAAAALVTEDTLTPRGVAQWDKAAIGEISLHFEVSRSQARRWVNLAEQLDWLPLVRAAFLDGAVTERRARILGDALCAVDKPIREQLQAVAVRLAADASADRTLAHQLAELIILIDPEAAADAREELAAQHQHVRVRDEVHGHAALDAILPAEVGVHIIERIKVLIGQRVCSSDPRALGQLRAIALAELVGTPGVRLT